MRTSFYMLAEIDKSEPTWRDYIMTTIICVKMCLNEAIEPM